MSTVNAAIPKFKRGKPSHTVYLKIMDAKTNKQILPVNPYSQIHEYTYMHEPGKHEVMTAKVLLYLRRIRYSYKGKLYYRNPPVPMMKVNQPVSIIWGDTKTGLATTPAYVTSARITSSKYTTNSYSSTWAVWVEYTFVGASYKLQTPRQRSWKRVSYSYLAREIARANGMQAVVDPHSNVWDQVIQNQETDFKFLQRIATEVGYQFFVRGTTIYFIQPKKVFTTQTGPTPSFRMDKRPAAWDTLRAFKSLNDGLPTGTPNTVRKVFGLNPNNGAVIESRNQYLDFTAFDEQGPYEFRDVPSTILMKSDRVIESFGQGQDYARFAALVNSKWVQSSITADGNVNVAPGGVISLSGEALIDRSDGFWYVEKVKHIVSPDWNNLMFSDYVVEATISRDQFYDANFRPTQDWTKAANASPILVNGTWKAVSTTPVEIE